MFRKIIVVFLALALICAVSACGTQDKTPEGGSAEPLAGGWELYANGAAALPEDVQAAFEKAAETYTEGNLVPVAYVASQVVAGTNYMILCQEASDADAPAGAYQMVIVYSGFDGSAEIINSASFDLTAYTGGEDTEISAEQLAGGWQAAEELSSAAIPQEAEDAFGKAAEKLLGNDLEPLALLGTQIVAGTNYAFLCRSTLQTSEPVRGIQVVTVYQDLEGNAEIISICTVDPAGYNE